MLARGEEFAEDPADSDPLSCSDYSPFIFPYPVFTYSSRRSEAATVSFSWSLRFPLEAQ